MKIQSIDPATGETVRTYDFHPPDEVERRVDRAHEAFGSWSRERLDARAAPLHRAAELLEERGAKLARLMAEEMGKPLAQGTGEVEKCAWACRFFAERAERLLADDAVETDGVKSFVCRRPLGPVLGIMPWNFPLWQVVRFAAPALMAGNGALVKPAPNVPACALALEELLDEAGLPAGLFAVLFVEEERALALLEDPRVAAATVTGSVAAGSAVAARAGAEVKKTVLELGGSDPYLILEDADLESAADACVTSRMTNNGQSCIAAKRFLVVRDVREEFERLVVDRMSRVEMGPPTADGVDLGPLAREDLREELHRQVTQSIERGARVRTGGAVPDGPGWYYPPTVLVDVRPGMPVFDEETFGPVAALVEADDEADAIRTANASQYGLGAAVFTSDVARGERIAREELQADSVFVNDRVRSDPRIAFGGIKRSGHGRELGALGIREFTNAKTVRVAG